MRSGTSFFNGTVFKKTVFRFWPMWTVYLVGWLFALPLNGLTMLRLDANAMPGIDYGYLENFALYTVPGSVTRDVTIVFLIFGALAAMAAFSHLYNSRSANLFGSLPIRREGLFLTHYLAGLAFLIVPNLVIFLLTLAVEAAGGCVCMEGLLFWLAVSCGEGFFFYTLAVFCAMFTGHILALPAFYAIVNGLVMGITGLVYIVLESFYYGFASLPAWLEVVVRWGTPMGKLYDAVRYERYALPVDPTNSDLSNNWQLKIEGLGTVGIYALAAVLLAACAFFLYRARHLENAGDVVAVSWMKPVFKYGVALCVGLAFGLGTMVILYGGEIGLMIAIVVWGVIGYFAAEMLLQKSFKVFKKWKGAVAVAAVFIALFCVVGFDLTGFETRVPDPASVESVSVSGLAVMYLHDDGDYMDSGIPITDPEAIRLITLVHRAAVEQRDVEWTEPGATTHLRVTYHLKNGGTLSRYYSLVWVECADVDKEGTAAWALQQLYNNRALYWQMYGFDKLENYLAQGGRLSEAEYNLYDDEVGWINAYFYGADAEALLAAVKEDFFAGRIGARRVVADRWEGYDRNSQKNLSFSADGRDGGYCYVNIAVSETATSTRAALEELADRAVWPDTSSDTDEMTIQDIVDRVTQ